KVASAGGPPSAQEHPAHCKSGNEVIVKKVCGIERIMQREFPEAPLVGVGAVVVDQGRVLLVRRGTEPLRGEWSLPGGLLEVGESLNAGVVREVREETGL